MLEQLIRHQGVVADEALVGATWLEPLEGRSVHHALDHTRRTLQQGLDDVGAELSVQRELDPRCLRLIAEARMAMPARHETLKVGELTLNLTTGVARRGKRSISLTSIGAALLASLMRAPDRVVGYQELIDEHWQGWTSRDNLTDWITRLRRELGRELILSVKDTGYQLNAPHLNPNSRYVQLQAGRLQLNTWHRRATYPGGGTVALTPAETRLLACLMQHGGKLVTVQKLMRTCEVANLAALMSGVRRKLGLLGADNMMVRIDGGFRLTAGSVVGLRRIGGLELDLRLRAARLYGRPLELWPTAIALLERLAVAPDTTVSSVELVEQIWGPAGTADVLDASVTQLQAALGKTGALIVRADDGYRLAVKRFGLLAIGPLLLDRSTGAVRLADLEAQLLPRETALMTLLMRNRGSLLAPEQIAAVFGVALGSPLEMFVHKLRVKLDRLNATTDGSPLIVGARGGYRLAVEHLDDDETGWLRFADLRFNPRTRQLRNGDRAPISLSPKAAVMLEQLINGGGFVDDDTLVRAGWSAPVGPTAVRACQQLLQRGLDEVDAALRVQRAHGGHRLLAKQR
jgi:DNA-binding response OmpR family regulator